MTTNTNSLFSFLILYYIMFNLSSYWSRKIPERGGCVSFLPNFSNEPTLLHAEFYSNKLVANLCVACDNYFYGGFIKKKFTI